MADEPDFTRQDPPQAVEGATSSHDAVIADLRSWALGEVTQDTEVTLLARKVYGLEKYGVVLHKDNGRDHDLDAEDEALDLAVYLRTWMDHDATVMPILYPLYQDVLWALVTIHRLRVKLPPPIYHTKVSGPIVPLGLVTDEPED